MQEIKINSQLYTTQEGIAEIKNNPLGIHYSRGVEKWLKITHRYTLQKRV